MEIGTYLIFVQNAFLVLVFAASTWTLCKGKPKEPVNDSRSSNEALNIQSAMQKQPEASGSQARVAKDSKKDVPAAGSKKEPPAATATAAEKEKPKDVKDPSMKPFPKFVMPTESTKNKKLQAVEQEKQEKIKMGFFQPKSDQDDTLEKVESLDLEHSERTRRALKNKKK